MAPREGMPERTYRRLLRLYPARFRAHFGDEMVQLFADQLRDARRETRPGGTAWTWLGALSDLVVNSASEHARRDRTVAQSLAAPSIWTRMLGIVGILGGLVLVVVLLPTAAALGAELSVARIVLFNAGAIAIAFAVHRLNGLGSRRRSLAVAGSVVAANAWGLVMVILSIGRPQPPEGDPEFRLIAFYASVAMWLADALFGFVIWRVGVIARWVGLALGIASLVALLGIDRFELVRGDFSWLIGPVALTGVAVSGLAWILLGLAIATRGGGRRPAEPDLAPPSR